jgi:hypothetical protein
MRLLPRLNLEAARSLAEKLSALSVEQAAGKSATDHPSTVFAPTGGVRLKEDELEALQNSMRAVARGYGYPGPLRRSDQGDWDAKAAIVLHGAMGIRPAEAVHAGGWAFLGCVLLPDLVRWRFSGDRTTPDRFLGKQRGIRNTFGRLWWRAELLGAADGDEGRTRARKYMDVLGEDQLVQITERPEMAADRRVARAIAECWVQLREEAGGRSEDLMREAVKRVRRRLAFVAWEVLPEATVQAEIRILFEETLQALSPSDSQPG